MKRIIPKYVQMEHNACIIDNKKHFFVSPNGMSGFRLPEDDVEARQSLKVDSQKITQLLNELELECDEGIQYFSSLKKRISDKRRLFFEQTHKEMKTK